MGHCDSVIQYFQYIHTLLNTPHTGGGKTPSRKKTTQLIQQFKERGWRQNAIETALHRLDDTHLQDYRPEEAIYGFTNVWLRNHPEYSTLSIKDTLIQLGVRKRVAEHIERIVEPLKDSCYTHTQLQEIAIDVLRGAYTGIGTPGEPYLLFTNSKDEWIDYKDIKILNTSAQLIHTNSVLQFLEATVATGLPITPDKTYYYHLTNWGAVNSIIDEINHLAGQKCLDFGYIPGFYIGDSISNAIEWGIKNTRRYNNELAIFVFGVPHRVPPNIRVLELEGEVDVWKTIMAKSRRCQCIEPEIEELRGVDIVSGYMVKNAQAVAEGRAPKMHSPPKFQLASKRRAGDAFLQSCLLGCIFFSKL